MSHYNGFNSAQIGAIVDKLAEFHAVGSALLLDNRNNNNTCNNTNTNNDNNNNNKNKNSNNKNNSNNQSKTLRQELEEFQETKCDTEIIYQTLSPFFKVSPNRVGNLDFFSQNSGCIRDGFFEDLVRSKVHA